MSRLTILGKLTKWMVYFPAFDTLRMETFTWFSYHGIKMMDNSYKLTHIISPGARDYVSYAELKQPAIYAIYHQRLVGLLGLKPRNRLTILISDSRDGEIVTRALRAIGFSVARGSNKRKAVQGAKALVDAAKAGQSIAFMVDGPRGPIYEPKLGVIRLAELTQLPIIPFVSRSRSAWWFPSWDKFMGALWATPMVYMFGEPVHVPAGSTESEREELLSQLRSRMDFLRERSDHYWT